MKNAAIRRTRGVTLIEALFASFLTMSILTVTLSLYITGMMAWSRGEGKILSETGTHQAIRVMANELRQALNVSVDTNGNGITYQLPLQAGGTDVLPIQTDGLTHRIELDGTDLNMLQNGVVTRTICSNVVLTDPLSAGGTTPYQIFTPNVGSTIRQITVEVAIANSSYMAGAPNAAAQTQSARNRETIYLRNVPSLIY